MSESRYKFPKSMHLQSSLDFQEIYADGQRAGDEHLLIFARSNKSERNRLGLSISRKHGSAIRRNLKRRRIREAFRALQHDLPRGFDLIVVPRQREDSTFHDYRNSLQSLIRRLSKRIATARSDSDDNVRNRGADS